MSPTPYAELDEVLAELVARVGAILGDSLVGVYLQGSFALGAGSLGSDCDFLVVTRRPVDGDQEAALRSLHAEIPGRDGFWTHHLEGSYPLLDDLRSLDGLGREWLYVDHGASEMEWSTHCNTEVTRWVLREHGVALVGPPAASLVDPVPPEALRARMRQQLPALLDALETWAELDTVAWAHRYAVATAARMLYTLAYAEVCSKPAALDWAAEHLDERWQPLLDQVRPGLGRAYDADEPPPPGAADRTRAFIHAVVDAAADH